MQTQIQSKNKFFDVLETSLILTLGWRLEARDLWCVLREAVFTDVITDTNTTTAATDMFCNLSELLDIFFFFFRSLSTVFSVLSLCQQSVSTPLTDKIFLMNFKLKTDFLLYLFKLLLETKEYR